MYTENDNSEFFQANQAVNLENIIQACPVSFETHRVNKDFNNYVKD